MEFARRDRVPDHWRTFSVRRSPLTLAPHSAANPHNAILNYLYTLLEVETRVALIARGLDPGLALFHADEANRQSLAADVMEPVRPHVDAFVLNLARTRTFSAKDFAETREGACRLASSLAQELAPTMATWAKLRCTVCRGCCEARRPPREERPGHGRADRAEARARSCSRVRGAAADCSAGRARCLTLGADLGHFSNACRSCGAKLAVRKRVYCDRRLPDRPRRLKFSAAVLLRPRSSAKPQLRGAMTHHSVVWISGAIFCRGAKLPGARGCRGYGREHLARLEGAQRAARTAQAPLASVD